MAEEAVPERRQNMHGKQRAYRPREDVVRLAGASSSGLLGGTTFGTGNRPNQLNPWPPAIEWT